MLGSMAVVLALQAKQLHTLLQQAGGELRNRAQRISQLKDENKTSKEQLSTSG